MANANQRKPANRRPVKRKASAKKKKTLAVIIALIVCAVAIIVLYTSGVLRLTKVETVVNNRTGIAYVNSTEGQMIINSEGRVLEKAEIAPEDIPQLTGIAFTKIAEGEKLEYDMPDAFDYAIKLVMALRTNDIYVSEININSNYEATAYVNKVTILFGTDNKTEIKAADLADFFDQVKDLKGTLHMEEVNEKLGYIFKKESENTAIIEDKTNGSEEETTTEENAEGGEEVYYEEYYEEPYYEEEAYYEEEWVEEPYYEEEVYYEEPVYEEEY